MKCLKGGKTRTDLIFKDLQPRAGQAVRVCSAHPAGPVYPALAGPQDGAVQAT